ncbi:MAG: DNA-binding protein [Prevotella sp.]|nr:DNA-binding protein [Prevotella sp.]
MKLKYLFPSLIAAITMLVSCSDDNDPTYLDEIRVSSSYVALDVNGGTTSIDIEAKSDWSINQEEIPNWLTITPVAGSGNGTISFSAGSTLDGRTAELHINCGDKTQTINVIQGLAEASPATCAEVIAGPDSKQYLVTGTVTSIANTLYGNWYLTDETGTVYIYGTLDAKGNTKNFESLGLEVGDIVTVKGPKTTYGTTVELVDVTVVNIEKSLIKVDSLDIENNQLPLEGGDFTVSLTCKGSNGVSVEIPSEAKDWLSIVAVNGGSEPTVKFHAAANAGGDREATIVFNTTDGKKTYSSETTITQKGSIIAVSVAEFLAAEPSNTLYRVSGIITKVANASYGNCYIKDFSGETYVYGIGAKGDFEALGLKEGDIVTLVGKRGEYKGDPQMAEATAESFNIVTEVSIEEFLTKEDNPNVYYRVTGNVTEIANATYGNLYISNGANSLYVYGCYPGWGATGDARKDCIATQGIEVGDELTVIGSKSTYNGTPQVNGGIYFSHKKPE